MFKFTVARSLSPFRKSLQPTKLAAPFVATWPERRSGELGSPSRLLTRASEYLVLEQQAGRGGSKKALREAVRLIRKANKRAKAAEGRAEERRYRTSPVRVHVSLLSPFSRVRTRRLIALSRW